MPPLRARVHRPSPMNLAPITCQSAGRGGRAQGGPLRVLPMVFVWRCGLPYDPRPFPRQSPCRHVLVSPPHEDRRFAMCTVEAPRMQGHECRVALAGHCRTATCRSGRPPRSRDTRVPAPMLCDPCSWTVGAEDTWTWRQEPALRRRAVFSPLPASLCGSRLARTQASCGLQPPQCILMHGNAVVRQEGAMRGGRVCALFGVR